MYIRPGRKSIFIPRPKTRIERDEAIVYTKHASLYLEIVLDGDKDEN